jgi:hypothetical protein
VRPQLALDLLRAMKQFDATKVTPEAFQPLVDATCGTQEEDAAHVDGETQKKVAKKKKKIKKEEMDIIKHMKEMEVAPSLAQAQQLLRWCYQDKHRLAQAAQLILELIVNFTKTQELTSLITEFMVQCAEHRDGIHVISVMKRMEGTPIRLTQEQYTKVLRSLLAHNLTVVALDVMRWMSTHARTEFVPVREQLLEGAPRAPWANALQKMS